MAFVPMAGPIEDARTAFKIFEAAKAIEAGNETDHQRDLMKRFARMELAAAIRGRSVTGWMGTILTDLPAFLGDIYITGGVGAVGGSFMFWLTQMRIAGPGSDLYGSGISASWDFLPRR